MCMIIEVGEPRLKSWNSWLSKPECLEKREPMFELPAIEREMRFRSTLSVGIRTHNQILAEIFFDFQMPAKLSDRHILLGEYYSN